MKIEEKELLENTFFNKEMLNNLGTSNSARNNLKFLQILKETLNKAGADYVQDDDEFERFLEISKGRSDLCISCAIFLSLYILEEGCHPFYREDEEGIQVGIWETGYKLLVSFCEEGIYLYKFENGVIHGDWVTELKDFLLWKPTYEKLFQEYTGKSFDFVNHTLSFTLFDPEEAEFDFND